MEINFTGARVNVFPRSARKCDAVSYRSGFNVAVAIRLPGRYRGGGFIVARANFQGGGHIHGSAVNRLAAIGIGGNRVSKEINFLINWQTVGKETGVRRLNTQLYANAGCAGWRARIAQLDDLNYQGYFRWPVGRLTMRR
ncbi:Uncharacterised protein [Salmonella enterica subsp. enterica]|uniref:Uncharacterized protein n=1 Tax=Salmonella enterica I TaxID=59201 RepID=A0A3S4LQM0_SALET|nr:Uncharacterised protein [Salmonella enterica subsp. enterica]